MNNNKQYQGIRLILGDQLNPSHSWFEQPNANYLYVIAELHQETNYTKHHIQKVAAFFKAMENFANALKKAGFEVLHLTLDDTAEHHTLADLFDALIQQFGVKRIEYQRPDEYRLFSQLMRYSPEGIAVQCVDTEHFLLPFSELDNYLRAGKHTTMEHFYRKLRKRFNILMSADGEPEGGQWNFDSQNRNKLKPADLEKVPKPLSFTNDISAILNRLQHHNITTIGTASSQLLWPVTRTQARELLDYFCQYLLPHFGRFQDAMTCQHPSSWSLYHSRLSFSINIKMLHPMQVIQSAINAYQNSDNIDIAQVEGFIRQILGWREYIRAVYWLNMPDYGNRNALEAVNKLPHYFWSGDTKMRCLQQAISQSLEYAYAHHIQRLMVTGNFCLLAGVHPDEVDQWYLGIYIDAIEWVEMPNTRGMTQFADGGIVATKPYAASGNYINKMSDYCKHCDYDVKLKSEQNACPLNSMYWHFMERHRKQFGQNHRIGMIYRNWDKQTEAARKATLERAQWCIEHLEEL
ncbi:cryptochrome/photolyase family protein [Pseudoalteromonas sp. T1lg65]|uniref:cryptochrome/photolyase family protein n=1 Tax=Pseudoalteromonas sp. T1lg65 TaxID=2077101 RepID=UPI003F7A9DAF